MKKLVSLVLAGGLLLAASAAHAGSSDTRWVARDWETPYTHMSTRLWMTDSQNRSVTIWVNVYLSQAADLRVGETEEFRVSGRLDSFGGNNGRVEVRLEPSRFYHSYPYSLVRHVSTWGGGSHSVSFYLDHAGRVEDGAAPSVDQVSVDYTDLDSPWKLRFRDFGFEENGSAPTSYQFSVARRQWLGDDKLVARGVIDRADAETQEFVVEKDGAYTSDGDEWFREGKEYVVRLRVRRTGTEWYTDEFGDPFAGVFEWNSQTGALRKVDERELDQKDRTEAFRRLHQ